MRLMICALAALMVGQVVACSGNHTQGREQVEVATDTAPLMNWTDLTTRPLPSPTDSVVLGERSADVVDVWLPEGEGPHPVVLMVHGGCWQKVIADRTLMNYAAEALRQEGLAVWNIEYRGVDEPGGGYPGTFQDVARAADAMREYEEAYNLDADRVVVTGHSAGGHLGAWLAARRQLSETSLLWSENPLPVYAVLNVGGLADLEASAPVTLRSCLSSIMNKLTGEPSDERPDVFSDTSPAELLPTGTRQISVNGERDGIAPPVLGEGYTVRAKVAGDNAEFVLVPGGHVELIAPGTAAFDRQIEIIKGLFYE